MHFAPSYWVRSKGCPMTDILIRICVGACGVMLFTGAVSVIAESKYKAAGVLFVPISMVTILRALGVL